MRNSRKGGRRTRQVRSICADLLSIAREVDYIIARAQERDARLVSLGPLVLFSTESGDAWLLDREDRLALCVARDGEAQRCSITESRSGYAIEWQGTFDLDGDAFVYVDRTGSARTVLGYPVAQLREAL